MQRDPIDDALQAVYCDGFAKGEAAGRLSTTVRGFWRGFFVGLILAIGAMSVLVARAQDIPHRANPYRKQLTQIARQVWGMDAPIAALAAQIEQESGWNANARSRVGASGLTQFMPATAADMSARHPELGLPTPQSPAWAMRAQSLYMRELVIKVRDGAPPCDEYCYALTGYNGGLRWVIKRKALSADPKNCFLTSRINPGISRFNQIENENYARRVLLDLEPRYARAGWGAPVCGGPK